MSDPTPGLCQPQPRYVIIEQIDSAPGMPSLGPLGPQLRKVQRRVLQVCEVEEIFYRGKRIQGMPGIFQYIDEFLHPGKRISTRPTGKKEFLLAYAGMRNLFTPQPGMSNLLPKALTKEYDLGVPLSPFVFGSDPIPNQQLFGNKSIDFALPGGQGSPTAVAIYDAKTGILKAPMIAERQQAIQNLLKSLQP